MTMFAMKPKFDLAAFLAETGPKTSQKSRYPKASQPNPRIRPDPEDAPVTGASEE